ncbi:hypothetical protein HPB50_010966 [Hyalomma asiaticum]|uniref:Uncharacterized protein n=1 Tax=Hyalomma asiaticum TaxID=266040 RepID=A0ACB7SPI3_HYAAI|nr:hypothetical protein HPB50_010966 [Hyalomma asiaticum]
MKVRSPALGVFLKKRNCRTLAELSQTVDNIVEAQPLLNLGLEWMQKEATSRSALKADAAKKAPGVESRYRATGNGIGQPNVGRGQEEVPEHVSSMITSPTMTGISILAAEGIDKKRRLWYQRTEPSQKVHGSIL